VILHVLALACFIISALISAYRAFSIFEPPLVPSKEVEEDRASISFSFLNGLCGRSVLSN